MHRRIYSSRTLTAWLAVFITCEIGIVYFFIMALAAHHRRAAGGVIILDAIFAVGVLLMVRDLAKTFGYRYETDGATWVRRFGQGVEQRVTKNTITSIRRHGLDVVLVADDQELPITRDCWGYEKLRDIAEEWAKTMEQKSL